MPVLTADVRFTTTYDGDHFQVTGEIIAGTMPRAVFLYRNRQETDQPTDYVGVASKEQMTRYPHWAAGPSQPLFGVPFIRHTVGAMAQETLLGCESWKSVTERDIQGLKSELELYEPLVEIVTV